MGRLLAAMLGSLLVAVAQDPPKPALQNTGKPIQVDFSCSEQDIEWAGLGCSEDQPCPIYLELTAVEPVGAKIVLAGNLHAPSMTLYSILLASDDGGKTWREPFERLRGAGLEQIQFVDFENGWISGQFLHPLPADPFLLITSDGGKSWEKRPIYNESRYGTILQFWFDSKSTGSVVIDRGQSSDSSRYEIHESPNGGQSWMIREAGDRPLRLKRAPAANPDWRIRADRASRSFQIEARRAGRWVAAAGFLVHVGDCKPAERQLAAPPPEPETPAQPPAPPAPPAPKPAKPPSLKRPAK